MKLSKKSIFITFFLDNFGVSIIFPIFTPLFLNQSNPYFSNLPIYFSSTVTLGFLISCFPLAQFFGAPFIGNLSDQIGRRKAFLISISGLTISYLITAFALLNRNLILLFSGRMLSGFFAGNLTLCLVSLVDLSTSEESRLKNFSLLAFLGGIASVSSIAIGGYFSNSQNIKFLNPSIPFWILSCLFLINLLFVFSFFHETKKFKRKTNCNPFRIFIQIYQILQDCNLRKYYLMFFLFITGWITLVQFLPTILINLFNFSINEITLFFIGNGFFWSISNLIYSKFLINKISKARLLSFSFPFIFIMMILMYVFPIKSTLLITGMIYICIFFSALSWSNSLAIISLKGDQQLQGKIMGLNQSFTAIGGIIGPSIGGIITKFSTKGIFLFVSLFFLGAIICLKSLAEKKYAK